MRTRMFGGLTKAKAEEVKLQYEKLGWTVVIIAEGGGKFQVKATK